MNIAYFFTSFTWIIGLLVLAYSVSFLKNGREKILFFIFAAMSLIAATGAFNAGDIVVFLVWWGCLLLLLYAMISLGSFKTAANALTVIGLSDFCLLSGTVLLIAITKSTKIADYSLIPTDNALTITAFILMAVGAAGKAGVFGFHNWIVEAGETNNAVTMAFLPASLDKFLGIYLFLRVMKDFFAPNPELRMIFMGVGAVSIILAVFMAMAQHNLKKLLSYHAVSQVGYMILGIASGTLIGIAGGIFHMLNNTVYKTSLFLNAGNLEQKFGSSELSKFGGLAKYMPLTLAGTVVASLAISGVPPFNGFVSKWMVYSGLLNFNAQDLNGFKIAFIVMAMFGSALTLASFVKVIYSVFFGEPEEARSSEPKEVGTGMWVPILILSVFCILFGLFAESLIIRPYIDKILHAPVDLSAIWDVNLVAVLIILALTAGIVYALLKWNVKTAEPFIGGEKLCDSNCVQGNDFYLTIMKDVPVMKVFYKFADMGGFDFYRHITSLVRFVGEMFYFVVNGIVSLLSGSAGKKSGTD